MKSYKIRYHFAPDYEQPTCKECALADLRAHIPQNELYVSAEHGQILQRCGFTLHLTHYLCQRRTGIEQDKEVKEKLKVFTYIPYELCCSVCLVSAIDAISVRAYTEPMAEDTLHRKLMAYCCDALEFHFASRPDVYVAGNDFLYYEEGNPKARVSPDCYVAIGIEPKTRRRFYKAWEERGVTPSVVIELTSKKTKKEDVTIKKPLYEQTLRVEALRRQS